MMTLQELIAALALPEFDGQQAQMQMAPAGRAQMRPRPDNPPRDSAVLVLLYPDPEDGLSLILTRRAERLRGHRGQVSFPGGQRDPEDISYEATALRETCEELGICSRDVRLLGQLTPLWIPPSNYHVVPVVGYLPQLPPLKPNPDEVAEVLLLSVQDLLAGANKRSTPMMFRNT
ncbi:MAG: CoA pyrophosphatase, partial [Anaerolineae bacterium]|nr:CoA pyrophosphatase [Anaerolineae bacterium]